jgi:Restriction endonuclease NaeI
MKRVRGGGGARDQLRGEGIVIFGDYAGDQALAGALGLPRPGPGEFVSARVARRAPSAPARSASTAPTGYSPTGTTPQSKPPPAPPLTYPTEGEFGPGYGFLFPSRAPAPRSSSACLSALKTFPGVIPSVAAVSSTESIA